MAENSKIEWCDATWNPITGCSVVSPGCTNCYAMRLAGTRLQHHASRAGLTRQSKAGPVWTGDVRLNAEWLDQPLRWKRPRRIFVCAHSDLFHESVPDEWIDQVFAVMALAESHTFQVLTKRAERMRAYCNGGWQGRVQPWLRHFGKVPDNMGTILSTANGALRNVWLGVSAEDQRRADERIPHLLATPAAVRWVSAEPLLGPIDMLRTPRPGNTWDWLTGERENAGGRDHTACIDWIVAGGESGPGARPMHPDWARSLRDQCKAAGVPFFFKQHGDWREWDHQPEIEEVDAGSELADAIAANAHNPAWITQDGRVFHRQADLPDGEPCCLVERIGKTRAGRLLDGREHSEFPR